VGCGGAGHFLVRKGSPVRVRQRACREGPATDRVPNRAAPRGSRARCPSSVHDCPPWPLAAPRRGRRAAGSRARARPVRGGRSGGRSWSGWRQRGWGADALVALRQGRLTAALTPTPAEAAEGWVVGARAGAIRNRSGDPYKPSVVRGYEKSLRLRILPALRGVRLSDLRRAQLRVLVERMLLDGLGASTTQAEGVHHAEVARRRPHRPAGAAPAPSLDRAAPRVPVARRPCLRPRAGPPIPAQHAEQPRAARVARGGPAADRPARVPPHLRLVHDRPRRQRQGPEHHMGHSSVTIMFDRYGHLMPGNREFRRAIGDRSVCGGARRLRRTGGRGVAGAR
jgi:hypothetical protein